ncbi:MAG: Flp pilus assembly complex ATPase component TadA [Candidatus Magnetoovum sp. WYHC-5]|nr:Flp pilus assembly complex ATPase component TadA [Candidatus Magnetoovum sp. WYHC-5]
MSKFAKRFLAFKGDEVEKEVSKPDEPVPENKIYSFTLLFVDDEANVLKALERIFFEENYEILTALSGEDAMAIMETHPVHLVISDHRMPNMLGSEFLKKVKERWPDTIRIMLTGHADVEAISGAVNEGAVYKFIIKPWNDEDLRLTVALALQQYVLIHENKELKQITKKQQEKIKDYSKVFNQYRGILGKVLVKLYVITNEQLDRALNEKLTNEFIADAIVRLGFATESKIASSMEKYYKLNYVDLKEFSINPIVARLIPQDICENNRIMPIKLENNVLTLAMVDPSDYIKIDNISFLTGFKVVTVIAKSSDIVNQLKSIYGDGKTKDAYLQDFDDIDFGPIEDIDIIIDEQETDSIEELITEFDIPPIVRIVNTIIMEALRYQASDVHIEPKLKYAVVRYRIDGMLYSKIKLPLNLHPPTVSRIKILAKMDIAERRRPQDGRISIKAGTRIVDVRVSTMPTINGEKIVMRVLDKGASVKKLIELGMDDSDLKRLNLIINKPQGLLITTGPTGGGKTTTLYSILQHMLQPYRNFETIEDPVEYFIEDVNQVYVKEKMGLSFASILRSSLRQDPDIILVGEIRDFETADVAFKAGLTGHMVLTTLHTNDSITSITRLMDIGVKPYLIASALEGIISQRLIRAVCKYCKTVAPPDSALMELLNIQDTMLEKVAVGRGCSKCNNSGYLGRTGIFEIFLMNDEFRHIIHTDYRESELRNLAKAGGMVTLMGHGLRKVKEHITTLEELLRVIGPPTRYEKECVNCKKFIDIRFLYCPYCGIIKENICHNCKIPLEVSWGSCPYCGALKGRGKVV